MTNARTTLPNEEREVDPAAAAKVKALLEDDDLIDNQDAIAHAQRPADAPPAKTRKQRSDKGMPKVVKSVPAAASTEHLAVLQKDQAAKLRGLTEAVRRAEDEERGALNEYQEKVLETSRAKAAWHDYINALTVK